MSPSKPPPFPLDQWSAQMRTAIEEICATGSRLLATHRTASESGSRIADQWQLEDRLEAERGALQNVLSSLHQILAAIDSARRGINRANWNNSELRQSMADCADLIRDELPKLEVEFLQIRHSALDLLRWARQFARIDTSELPDDYRASYGKLLSFTPFFRPQLEAIRGECLQQSREAEVPRELHRMFSALDQYISAVESARAFVTSVVSPPIDLVFHHAESFEQDWQRIEQAVRGQLATAVNDCCQFLLYDPATFNDLVTQIEMPLSDGIDASLYVLPVDQWRIVLTMDDDPVFEQLNVTLLRIVSAEDLDSALSSLVKALYRDFSDR